MEPRDEAARADGIAHEGQRADGWRLVDRHAASSVEDGAAKGTEVFDEHRDQAFVAGTLPDETESSCARLHARSCGNAHIVE